MFFENFYQVSRIAEYIDVFDKDILSIGYRPYNHMFIVSRYDLSSKSFIEIMQYRNFDDLQEIFGFSYNDKNALIYLKEIPHSFITNIDHCTEALNSFKKADPLLKEMLVFIKNSGELGLSDVINKFAINHSITFERSRSLIYYLDAQNYISITDNFNIISVV